LAVGTEEILVAQDRAGIVLIQEFQIFKRIIPEFIAIIFSQLFK
jgi:hypothetical protein